MPLEDVHDDLTALTGAAAHADAHAAAFDFSRVAFEQAALGRGLFERSPPSRGPAKVSGFAPQPVPVATP